ncbi:MAG: DUF72 domain-containing protein [Deltaproteobacteria bacterium]|nr:DUF72 domain-containing protein [Deltaproteobacteria bacterium]
MTTTGRIEIGTSGWHYAHWRGVFYPGRLDGAGMLAHYARLFRTVEINRTFYSLPAAEVLQGWREATPPDFGFAVKASRYITHLKKLTDCGEAMRNLLAAAENLRPKLGPLLFQLPPRWQRDTRRLAEFLPLLPPDQACAFEFRDPAWFHPEVYEESIARGVLPRAMSAWQKRDSTPASRACRGPGFCQASQIASFFKLAIWRATLGPHRPLPAVIMFHSPF